MESMVEEIIWSCDEDQWWQEEFEEVLDCLEVTGELEVGRIIYQGTPKRPSPIFIGADDVIELISERAYDIGGEYAYDYPDVSDEQKQELEDFLDKWQRQFIPSFYTVQDVKGYVITQEDIDKFRG